jgi:hypothetical protein
LTTGVVPLEQRIDSAPPPPPNTCPLAVVNRLLAVPKFSAPKFSPVELPAPLT